MADRRVVRFAALLSVIVLSVAAGIGTKDTLKITKFDVPRWVDLRGSVTLVCQYDLVGQKLYSVKWYKDQHEIFRYTPWTIPSSRAFNSDGINVDEGRSSPTQVTLYPLSRKTSGNYKCEVSVDAPNFPIDFQDANMTVIALPEEGVKIEGLKQYYTIGEYLEANCTAKMTFPVAQISWYINNIEVDSYLLERYSSEVSEGPFYNSTVGMRFPLKKEFADKNKKGTEVKCTAKVAGADAKTDEKIIQMKLKTDHTLSQERHIYNNTGNGVSTKHWAIVLTTLVLHYYEAYN